MQRHKQIALLALDGEDIDLAKKHLEAALSTLNEVVVALEV